MSEFAVMIATPSKQYFFDAIDSFQVSANNQITSHPLANGEEIADHMIVQPCTITVTGDFSMNGSTRTSSLATLQKEIEDIKDNGILCTVARCKLDGKEFRFLKRNNMCLNSVTWTEGINSMSFNFTFQQVMIFNVIERRVVNDIQNLPDITAPTTLNCVGSLISTDETFKLILQALVESKIVETDFIEAALAAGALTAISVTLMKAVVGTVATAVTAASAAAAAAGTSLTVAAVASAIPVAGWIAAGVLLVGAAIAGIFAYTYGKDAAESAQSQSKLRQLQNVSYKTFKKQSDAEKEREEYKRFNDMMDAIYAQVNQLNSWIRCYTFEENTSQETMVNVGSDYLVFTFRRNNLNSAYNLRISDVNGNARFSDMIKAADSENLSNANALCKIGEYSIHMIGDMTDLTKCTMIISQIDIAEFNEALVKLIESAISDNPKSETEGE